MPFIKSAIPGPRFRAGWLVLTVLVLGSIAGRSSLAGDDNRLGPPDSIPPVFPEADCLPNYEQAQRDADYKAQGEFAGKLAALEGTSQDFGAQVVAIGCGKFHMVVYPGGLPGTGWTRPNGWYRVNGATKEGETRFKTDRWSATLAGDRLRIATSSGVELGVLKRIARESPTLGRKPPEGAVVLFDGSSAEQFEDARLDAEGGFIPGKGSRRPFGDCTLHLEFRIPFVPEARGQGRCNSGVFFQGRYEVQVLDSFGLEGLKNECGGVYRVADPRVNMCFPPGVWQTYDAEFTAPRFDSAGKKIRNAELTLRHNGVLVHEHLDVFRTTASDSPPEAPGPHPLVLQGRDPVVVYRNIWLVEKAP